jgi:hypothetical protein
MGRCAGARATSRRWREDGFLLQRIFPILAQNRSSLPRGEGSAFGENPTLGGRGQYRRS